MGKKVNFNGEKVSHKNICEMLKNVIFCTFQRSRRFSYDDQTVMIAEYLQDWCDKNNKLVLVSYDTDSSSEDTSFKLSLEVFGFKQTFTKTSSNVSDALNDVSRQAIQFLIRSVPHLTTFFLKHFRRFQIRPIDLPSQLASLFSIGKQAGKLN